MQVVLIDINIRKFWVALDIVVAILGTVGAVRVGRVCNAAIVGRQATVKLGQIIVIVIVVEDDLTQF